MPDGAAPQTQVFFDTNILLYLFDRASQEKRQIAQKLFNDHQQNGTLRFSLQVVHEFAANLLSKKFGVPRSTVADVVEDLLTLNAIPMLGEDTLVALRFMGVFNVSFWDALILAAAKREGCSLLYSEDFQHGRTYDTVKVVNPFLGRDVG